MAFNFRFDYDQKKQDEILDGIRSVYKYHPNPASFEASYSVANILSDSLNIDKRQALRDAPKIIEAYTGYKLDTEGAWKEFGKTFKAQWEDLQGSMKFTYAMMEPDPDKRSQKLAEASEYLNSAGLTYRNDFKDMSLFTDLLVASGKLVPSQLPTIGMYIGGIAASGVTGGASLGAARVGSAVYGAMMEAGSVAKELYGIKDTNGNKLSDEDVRSVWLMTMAGVGALNLVTNKFEKGVAEGFTKLFSKQAIKDLVKSGTITNWAMKRLGSYAMNMASESIEESMEELIGMVASNYIFNHSNETMGTIFKGYDSKEIISTMAKTAVETAKGMVLAGVPGEVLQSVSDFNSSNNAIKRQANQFSAYSQDSYAVKMSDIKLPLNVAVEKEFKSFEAPVEVVKVVDKYVPVNIKDAPKLKQVRALGATALNVKIVNEKALNKPFDDEISVNEAKRYASRHDGVSQVDNRVVFKSTEEAVKAAKSQALKTDGLVDFQIQEDGSALLVKEQKGVTTAIEFTSKDLAPTAIEPEMDSNVAPDVAEDEDMESDEDTDIFELPKPEEVVANDYKQYRESLTQKGATEEDVDFLDNDVMKSLYTALKEKTPDISDAQAYETAIPTTYFAYLASKVAGLSPKEFFQNHFSAEKFVALTTKKELSYLKSSMGKQAVDIQSGLQNASGEASVSLGGLIWKNKNGKRTIGIGSGYTPITVVHELSHALVDVIKDTDSFAPFRSIYKAELEKDGGTVGQNFQERFANDIELYIKEDKVRDESMRAVFKKIVDAIKDFIKYNERSLDENTRKAFDNLFNGVKKEETQTATNIEVTVPNVQTTAVQLQSDRSATAEQPLSDSLPVAQPQPSNPVERKHRGAKKKPSLQLDLFGDPDEIAETLAQIEKSKENLASIEYHSVNHVIRKYGLLVEKGQDTPEWIKGDVIGKFWWWYNRLVIGNDSQGNKLKLIPGDIKIAPSNISHIVNEHTIDGVKDSHISDIARQLADPVMIVESDSTIDNHKGWPLFVTDIMVDTPYNGKQLLVIPMRTVDGRGNIVRSMYPWKSDKHRGRTLDQFIMEGNLIGINPKKLESLPDRYIKHRDISEWQNATPTRKIVDLADAVKVKEVKEFLASIKNDPFASIELSENAEASESALEETVEKVDDANALNKRPKRMNSPVADVFVAEAKKRTPIILNPKKPGSNEEKKAIKRLTSQLYDDIVGFYDRDRETALQAEVWYHDDVIKFREQLEREVPEAANDGVFSVYAALIGLNSNGANPKDNASWATSLVKYYLRMNTFPYMTYKEKDAAFGLQSSGNIGVVGGTRFNTQIMKIVQLENIIKYCGSIENTAEWLLAEHTGSELLEVSGAKSISDVTLTGIYNGFDFLGPKTGQFSMALLGHDDLVVKDKWFSRTWNRILGTPWQSYKNTTANVLSKSKEKEPNKRASYEAELIAETPRNKYERNLMVQVITSIAKKLSEKMGRRISPSAVQALLWYNEQDLYRSYGLPVESQNFSGAMDARQRSLVSRGYLEEDAGGRLVQRREQGQDDRGSEGAQEGAGRGIWGLGDGRSGLAVKPEFTDGLIPFKDQVKYPDALYSIELAVGQGNVKKLLANGGYPTDEELQKYQGDPDINWEIQFRKIYNQDQDLIDFVTSAYDKLIEEVGEEQAQEDNKRFLEIIEETIPEEERINVAEQVGDVDRFLNRMKQRLNFKSAKQANKEFRKAISNDQYLIDVSKKLVEFEDDFIVSDIPDKVFKLANHPNPGRHLLDLARQAIRKESNKFRVLLLQIDGNEAQLSYEMATRYDEDVWGKVPSPYDNIEVKKLLSSDADPIIKSLVRKGFATESVLESLIERLNSDISDYADELGLKADQLEVLFKWVEEGDSDYKRRNEQYLKLQDINKNNRDKYNKLKKSMKLRTDALKARAAMEKLIRQGNTIAKKTPNYDVKVMDALDAFWSVMKSPYGTEADLSGLFLKKGVPFSQLPAALKGFFKQTDEGVFFIKNMKGMSIRDLQYMKDIMKNIKADARNVLGKRKESQVSRVTETVQKVLASTVGIEAKSFDSAVHGLKKLKSEAAPNAGKKKTSAMKKFDTMFLTMSRLVDRIDPSGALRDWMFGENGLDAIVAREERVKSERYEAAKAKMKELGIAMNDLKKKFITLPRENGQIDITNDMAVGIYLYSHQKDGLEKLLDVEGNGFRQDEIDLVINTMDGKYKEWGDYLKSDMLAKHPELADVYYRVSNKKLGFIANYFPLVRGAEEVAIEEMLDEEARSAQETPDKRMLYKRTGGTYALALNATNSWFSMVHKQEHYIASAQWVNDTQFMLSKGGGDLYTAIELSSGVEYATEFKDFVSRFARRRHVYDTADTLANHVMSNLAVARLGFNVITALKQIPSLMLFTAKFGPIRLAQTLFEVMAHPKATFDKIYALSPQMKNRNFSQEFQMVMSMEGKNAYQRAVKKIGEVGMYPIKVVDKIVVNTLWLGAYNKARSENKSEEVAALEATRFISDTQAGGGVVDSAAIYSTNSTLVKYLLMFTSQLNKNFNMLYADIPLALRQKHYKKAIAYSIGLGLSYAGILMAGGALAGDDDDDDDVGLIRLFLSQLAEQMPVIGSDISSIITGTYYDASDTLVIPELNSLVQAVKSRDPKRIADKTVKFGLSAGELGGLPSGIGRKAYDAFNKDGEVNLGYMLNSAWADYFSDL